MYRGLQRALDLGGPETLRAYFEIDGPMGQVWLSLRPLASMKEKTYNEWALLRVHGDARILERLRKDPSRGCNSCPETVCSDKDRMVATRVLDGYCECQAGTVGRCHHFMTILQPVRLVGMRSSEVTEMDQGTVTGRQCEWIS